MKKAGEIGWSYLISSAFLKSSISGMQDQKLADCLIWRKTHV